MAAESNSSTERIADFGSGSDATSEVIVPTGPENRLVAASELLRAEAGDVRADVVELERSGAETVTAERVVMTNSGARTVDARSAQIDRSGVLAVRSDKSVFYKSTALAVASDEARIVRGRVLAFKTEQATIEGDARIGIYAGPPSDSVRPLLNLPGAVAFGAGFGAVLVVLGALLRRAFRRR